MLHLELAEQGLEAEIDLVPGAFDGGDRVGTIGEVAQAGRLGEEMVDLLLFRAALFRRGDDGLEALGDDALELEELHLVLAGELLVAREVDVVVKLLPALDVVLEVEDEFFDVLVVHGGRSVRVRKLQRGGLEEDQRAAAQLARGDGEAAEVQVQVGEREVRLLRGTEDAQHLAADLEDRVLGKGRRQRGGDETAAAVQRKAAARQPLRPQRLFAGGRTVSGGPFRFDLFHGFANMRQRGGTRKAHAEILFVAGENGHVPLRAERVDVIRGGRPPACRRACASARVVW